MDRATTQQKYKHTKHKNNRNNKTTQHKTKQNNKTKQKKQTTQTQKKQQQPSVRGPRAETRLTVYRSPLVFDRACERKI